MGFPSITISFFLLRKSSIPQRKVLLLIDHSSVAVSYTTLRKPQIGGAMIQERAKAGKTPQIFVRVIIQNLSKRGLSMSYLVIG